MKAGLILLGLLSVISAAQADATFYGAWYTVSKADAGAKDSGGATIVLRGDVTNPQLEAGDATISAVVNARGFAITFRGRWIRGSGNALRVEFGPERPTNDGQLSWHGSANLVSGQCADTWADDHARGRFQTKRQ